MTARRSDQVLAARVAAGDQQAFATVLAEYGPATYRFVLRMLDGDAADAEDAVQQTWIRVWTRAHAYRGDAALRTWLFTIAAREALALRRRRRPLLVDDRLLEPVPASLRDDPEDRATAAQLREDLQRALGELPWRQRASWLMREVEGLSYEEIAVALSTTTPVVRGQLHRARRALATRMEQWR